MNRKEAGFSNQSRVPSESLDLTPAFRSFPDELREVSLGDMARYARDAFPRTMAGALIVGVIGLGGTLGSRLLAPSVSFYRTAMVITMPGAAEGKYTNGTAFALTDIKSPVVLDEVFQANKLNNFGINIANFLGMVNVEAYAPAYDSIAGRFRDRLSEKALTFEEKKSIEAEFEKAIAGINAKGAIVTLTVSEGSQIPDSLAQKIVNDIPAKWASVFVERLGVANLPVPVSGTKLIDEAFLDDLDFPIAYDYLDGQSGKLRQQLADIRALPGAISFVSEQNKKGIADLQREAESIDQYRLQLNLKPLVDQGLSKNPDVTVLIYKNKISDLQKDAAVQAEYSGKVNTVINDFRSKKSSPSDGTGPASSVSAVSPSPQFDGAFLDRIIELSKQGSGVEFEQVLLQRKLELENLNVSYSDQMRRLTERRDAIVNNGLPLEIRKSFEDKFVAGLAQTTLELNVLWEDSFQFLAELNTKRLNNDKSLYRLSELPSELRMEKPSLMTIRSALFVLAAGALGALAGFANFAWRTALKNK